jgi:hypothetical protein
MFKFPFASKMALPGDTADQERCGGDENERQPMLGRSEDSRRQHVLEIRVAPRQRHVTEADAESGPDRHQFRLPEVWRLRGR